MIRKEDNICPGGSDIVVSTEQKNNGIPALLAFLAQEDDERLMALKHLKSDAKEALKGAMSFSSARFQGETRRLSSLRWNAAGSAQRSSC